MSNENNIEEAYNKFDEFMGLCEEIVHTNPMLVVLAMHDYFRNIYPVDPFLQKNYSTFDLENIIFCLENNIKGIKTMKDQLTYNTLEDLKKKYEHEDKINPQKLYGKLWEDRESNNSLDSINTLKDSFNRNGFDLKYFKNKKILDMGCGSGRFTIALAQLGAEKVTGIDLGVEGLKIAKNNSRNLNNIEFIEGSVLDLPFEKQTFDFVYCKGVLHHTGDLNKGVEELYRVLSNNGKAFLYLYGSGGLFWYSRKEVKKVMQLIPIDYTMRVLSLIGMPSKRTIFVDNWYVVIEDFADPKILEPFLKQTGFKNINRWTMGNKYHLETAIFNNLPNAKDIWGCGELRYILSK